MKKLHLNETIIPGKGTRVKVLPSQDLTADRTIIGQKGKVQEVVPATHETALCQVLLDSGNTAHLWNHELQQLAL
jgi:hypothetical protein